MPGRKTPFIQPHALPQENMTGLALETASLARTQVLLIGNPPIGLNNLLVFFWEGYLQ